MKANEAPENIYLSDFTDTTEAVFYVKKDKTKKTDIEYTRTDTFIKKACELMVNCIEDFMLRRMEMWDEECKNQTLENLREALKK